MVMEPVQVTDRVAGPGDTVARPNILARLKVEAAAMTPAERRVAGVITSAPEAVTGMSISELSTAAGVSESTTSRLCARVGTTGFPGLKISLARALERRPALSGNVEVGDDIRVMIEKVGLAEINDIKDTMGLLDPSAVEAAVAALDASSRVTTYAAGPSSFLALDAAQKLTRVGLTAIGHNDFHLAIGATAFMAKGDTAWAFSYSGRTAETVDFLREARRQGATTIAVTSAAGSPIADVADVLLIAAAGEGPFRTGATSSRIAQLVVVDIVFTALAAARYETTTRAYEKSYAALESRRLATGQARRAQHSSKPQAPEGHAVVPGRE